MVRYPVSVPTGHYRGSNARKINALREDSRICKRVEEYINLKMSELPNDCVHVFKSDFIAFDLGEHQDSVRDIVTRIDGGHNGVTVYKGDYDRAIQNPA